MSAVAAEKPWVCCPKGAPMPNHHQLHLTLVNVDEHSRASLCVHEEDDSKDGHLKLRTGPNKSTANRLYQTMPAKLEVEDVVILIRLWIKNKTARTVKLTKKVYYIYIYIYINFLRQYKIKCIQKQFNLQGHGPWPYNLCSPNCCSFPASKTESSCGNQWFPFQIVSLQQRHVQIHRSPGWQMY